MASSTSQLLLLVILLSVDAILLVDTRPPENKIVGGSQIDISQVPWQVALDIRGGLCGGSIINDRWVMTAAHCTNGSKASDVTVRAGSSYYKEGGSTYRVVEIVNHPRYARNYHNDIALLKTQTPITFGQGVARATLPTAGERPPRIGTPLTVTGWGHTSGSSQRARSEHLLVAEIKVEYFRSCQVIYRKKDPTDKIQICAGFKGRDACKGDSGGPLMAEGVVIGVVSYGDPNCGAHNGIYTKVSAYVDWINGHTQTS